MCITRALYFRWLQKSKSQTSEFAQVKTNHINFTVTDWSTVVCRLLTHIKSMNKYSFFFIFQLWIYIFTVQASAYDMKCSPESQRYFRVEQVCKKSSHSFYSCLNNTNEGTVIEFCNISPQQLAPGDTRIYIDWFLTVCIL